MQAVILAAGESSRFWPLSEGKHKCLLSLMGAPLIAWTLRGIESSGITDVIIIQSPSRIVEKELAAFAFNLKIKYVVQENPLGMGDALLTATEHLENKFFLLHAHQFLADTLTRQMSDLKASSGADLVVAGQRTVTTEKYGIFRLDGTRATGIVEKPTREQAPSGIRALGIYLLNREFVESLQQTSAEHYAFEIALNNYMGDHIVEIYNHSGETISLKYPWDLHSANQILMGKHLKPHISDNAQISPLAHITGDVVIEEGARVFEFAVIKGPCYVGRDCVVGTHALVRDFTNLEACAVIGAYGEAARSIFQENATTHSGFFGDSIFDRSAKIGAGTVTANVKVHRDEVKTSVKGTRVSTGLRSLGVVVGEGTQLGTCVNTMPGVLIGARSFVGPSTLVAVNVHSDTRLTVKQDQLIKEKRSRS